MANSFNNFSNYAHACGCTQIRGHINTHALAEVDGRIVYNGIVECWFTDNKYGAPEINVFWGLDDDAMHALGLYGTYTPHFQNIDFDGSTMVVSDRGGNYRIDFALPN